MVTLCSVVNEERSIPGRKRSICTYSFFVRIIGKFRLRSASLNLLIPTPPLLLLYHDWIVCKVRRLHISPPLFITVSCIVYFSCHTVITVMFICCVDVEECDDVQLFIRPHKSISLPSTLLLSIVGAGATILDLFIDCNTAPST